MNLNGVFRTGGYGLFFIDVPDLQQEKCIKTEEIDAIFGPWGDDFSWEPREDNVRPSIPQQHYCTMFPNQTKPNNNKTHILRNCFVP
jgi:hypothetical protein